MRKSAGGARRISPARVGGPADLVRRAGGVQGAEARYITQGGKSPFPMLMVWGPQADLARDPRWGRAEEVYGEDPFLNGVMATAFAPATAPLWAIGVAIAIADVTWWPVTFGMFDG